MIKSLVLIIMLLTINSSLALEEKTNNLIYPAKDYYKINKVLAHKILKNVPEYLILYYPTIVAEAKYRFQLIKPILTHITINLIIRSCFGLGYNNQMVYSTLSFLIINTIFTIANPVIDKKIINKIIAIFLQLSAEIFTSLYAIADSYDIMLLAENRPILSIITMILFPITTYNIIHNLYIAFTRKKTLSFNIINPRLILLNNLIKKNTPMYLYSKENYLQISQDDSLFTRINNWVASHKDDISLYNFYRIHEQCLTTNKDFVENNPIIEKINNYYIINYRKNSCTNLNTGLKFIRQTSSNSINRNDIEDLLDKQGHYIIEASKNIENFDITKDLPNDKYQYIVIINNGNAYYVLIGLQLTTNNAITKLFNKYFWPILFTDIPYNNYASLSMIFKSKKELINLIDNITDSFKECKSRLGIYKLKKLTKDEHDAMYYDMLADS